MTIDEMKRGRSYKIRYETAGDVETFDGCTFEGITVWGFDGGETTARGAVMYSATATPSPAVFWEDRIVEIVPV